MFLSDSNVNNQTWNLATTCTHSCLPHNNQCVLFVSRVSTWRSWKTVETESVHYENKTKSTTQASNSGKRSRRLKNHVSTRDKHGNSFFEINIIWTALTSGARVFDHRHQNKQDRKIISHPIHHVFPFSASWALESALSLRRTEAPRAPPNNDYTHCVLLWVTSARFCCLNVLIEADDGLLFSFHQHDYRLQTVLCAMTGGCRELLLPLQRSVFYLLGDSSSGQHCRRAFSTVNSS